MPVVALSLIGRKNYPIFFKRFDGHEDLSVQYLIHASMDVFDERLTQPDASRDPYLGLLMHMEGYAFFGYISNSLVKAVLVLDPSTPLSFDLGKLMKSFYYLYVDHISNPFAVIVESLPEADQENEWLSNDEKFASKVTALVQAANNKS